MTQCRAMNTWPGTAKAFPVVLQRNSFSPRLSARAGDVWRAMQDVVVDQSADVGWTPARYDSTNTMFVVRSMSETAISMTSVALAGCLTERLAASCDTTLKGGQSSVACESVSASSERS